MEASVLFRAYESAGAADGIIYMSVPLTSGARELALLERLGCSRAEMLDRHYDAWASEVLRPNEREASDVAAGLRARFSGRLLVNPSPLSVDGWSQPQYQEFWTELIRRFARLVVAAPGWELSRGCRREIAAALAAGIPIVDVSGEILEVARLRELDGAARERIARSRLPASDAAAYLDAISGLVDPEVRAVPVVSGAPHFKDSVLDHLATRANVAQFVSFGPGAQPAVRHHRIRGHDSDYVFRSAREAISSLLRQSPEGFVNVRSFEPQKSKGWEFLYGLDNVEAVLENVRRLAMSGLHTIVNERIDVTDGGVSGVAQGDLVEFSPGDVPRCVDKPGTATLERRMACSILKTVYGFPPSINYPPTHRVEFSIHPTRRGLHNEHTIIWELEQAGYAPAPASIAWPNNFSRFMGDKAFGLLVADAVGLPVPRTTVVGRQLAPFTFGRETGSGETWIRTCPSVPVPGRYRTRFGWTDPFRLVHEDDPKGADLVAVIAQEGADPVSSGAFIADLAGNVQIDGTPGRGDRLMLGEVPPRELSEEARRAVAALQLDVAARVGPARVEWVYDGELAWVVQLQRATVAAAGRTVVPGSAARYRHFDVRLGLEALRDLVAATVGTGDGIVLVGDVGVTSHFGDVLRQANVVSRIEPRPADAAPA